MVKKAKKKDTLKQTMDKIWPKTRKELEKALKNTKKLIVKGEKQVKTLSEKGAEQTKKLSLSLKKEKLCYDLGKVVANMPQNKWVKSKKVNDLVKEFKILNREIKKIK